MTAPRVLTAGDLTALAARLLADGVSVLAPVDRAGRRVIAPIADPGEMTLDGPLPDLPLKSLFLPPSEPLFHWRQQQHDVTLVPVETSFPRRVVIGVRPCDAAGVEAMDCVMGWDSRDELWFGRRAATTIVSLACDEADASCFCTAVGLGPAATKGSDVVLAHVPDGYVADVVTEKGAALFEHVGAPGDARATPAAAASAAPPGDASIDLARLRAWLGVHFEHEFWSTLGLRCHGCGACASVCPTCHCFDIVDEPDGLLAGTRRRNWDTCQSGRFTVHASGHNPRADQHARFRQRVLHKFHVYPERFGEVLCTGCGRCTRACPAGQSLLDILRDLDRLAAHSPEPPAVAAGVAR